MKNRYLAALQEGGNLLGMASVVALAAALVSPIPLLVGLVAEAAYLIFVPDTKWYESRLGAIHNAEIEARREQIKAETLPKLRPSMRTRFQKLEAERRSIDLKAAPDKVWMQEVLRKLDFLLEKFLQFSLKDAQFRTYLFESRNEIQPQRPPSDKAELELSDRWTRETIEFLQAAYQRDIAGVENHIKNETDDSTRKVLEKRLEVLRRRHDFIGRISKIINNLDQQLALLEDTFGLISDELLARAPEQVLDDIEDVVSQTNAMTQALEEMLPYERMLAAA